jgi:hypothetical protein
MLLLGLSYVSSFTQRMLRPSMLRLDMSTVVPVQQPAGDFAGSFLAQKNFILLEKFLAPTTGNLTETATEYVNFCDESFNQFLNLKIEQCATEKEKQAMGRIRYEVNSARQKKLIEADKILRGILASGGLKQMEAKLQFHLRRAEIDMAFMVRHIYMITITISL